MRREPALGRGIDDENHLAPKLLHREVAPLNVGEVKAIGHGRNGLGRPGLIGWGSESHGGDEG